jgi:hypothetical protein
MAGNLSPDKSGNIYVEFDYNNIILVDPNKIIDANNNVSERIVDHENLVMYANLEADVLPRTKLAVGISPEDSGLRTISVARLNFLKPTKNTYLGSGYYDELTGANSTKFDGTNQPLQVGQQPSGGAKPYFTNTVANEEGVIDNGLLGITSINITTNSSFIPSVTMQLEDVQGKALFQLGNNSPYSAFFNLPYPPFYLTLKGFYGQAVRYQLNLEKFHATFNSFSGNYQVTLNFRGYKFNVLNEIAMGHLLATPHMYSQRFNISQTPVTPQSPNRATESQSKVQAAVGANNPNSSSAVVTELVTEIGYQKIAEVYSEYKAKGLISKDLPELTLVQLMVKLENFENNIMTSFPKADVVALTNIRNYKGILGQYFGNIRGDQSSWFNKYLNPKPIYLKNGNKTYVFNTTNETTKTEALSLLDSNIKKYNEALAGNPTLGSEKIGAESPIPNPIKLDMIEIDAPSYSDIDWETTTTAQTGVVTPNRETIESVQSKYSGITNNIEITEVNGKKSYSLSKEKWFIFEGDGKFDSTISSLETQANKKLSDYESKISAELLRKVEDKDAGIGFKPTVRNIVAVIMASAEGFIRLMDDVHTKAWNVKYDPVRKNAILDNTASAPSSETRGLVKQTQGSLLGNSAAENAQIPVYPWPQFFVETPEDKKGRFQLKYIADPSVIEMTKGGDYSKWPEVQFVEEYMKGLTMKFQNPAAPPPLDNQRDTNIININPIEFPSSGIAYENKEEIKFYYEIWERQFLTSHYSGLIRANANQINDLLKLNIETEVSNITTSLGLSAPYITFKLKNYGLNASNYEQFLSTISNMGTGRAYQDYIRDFFVTPYIKSITENSYSVLSIQDLGKIPQLSTKSDALAKLISNASNTPMVVDTLPFTDASWCLNNLNQSSTSAGDQVYDTKKTLKVFEPRKIISNFSDVNDYKTNRPVTNFSYLLKQNPSITAAVSGIYSGAIPGLASFYTTRTPDNFIATEGYCDFTTPTGFLGPRTTTSMLNTPYFVNAIQNGVANDKKNDQYPYVQAAYLFLNSLPLASLREKYKTLSNDVTTDLDYIASCFNKFGAIHKIPYAWMVKYGSVWHRYKKFRDSGVDILTDVWKNFDYTLNFNPIGNNTTTPYSFKYGGVDRTVVLQSETTTDANMQVGFYPKLINDFNFFYNGYNMYSGYTNEEIQKSVNGGLKMYNFLDSNINNATQGTKNLRLITWSVLVPDLTPEISVDCDPKNNTKGEQYFVIPSFGTPFNQTVGSCITGSTTSAGTKVNLTSNSSVYNGSVRCLWSAPNFGYYDNNQIAFPQPDSYLNFINTGKTQTPIHFLSVNNYSKIEEVFSVFEKRILDTFEQEFLNFSKSINNTDASDRTISFGQSPVDLNSNYRNFQSLFKTLMMVPSQTDGQTENDYFNKTISSQYDVFQNGVRSFMEYDIIFRYGNPSNYNRRVFDSYISFNGQPVVTDPITFNPYVKGTLPTKGGGITLRQSKLSNPTAWNALETNVGFSTISGVVYSDNGSYITDFFVDNNIEFTAQNVVLLAPIIKMYATQKLRLPTTTVAQFKNILTQYLNGEKDLQNNFLNGVLSGVRVKLPNQQQVPSNTIQSAITGEQSKVENYEVFKALNDKWIAGGDYKTKTLFEDMMFLDRASRNIGDTILLDIFDLKYMFGVGGNPGEYSLNQAMSVYTFISGILIKNNFNIMNLPAYVNFYNVQDVDGTTIPKPEGSSDFANSLWGTYLDVDYRKSGPKMVCFYAGKPSQYLDLPKGNFKFRDDAFEMRRASENPLIEDQKGKKDWAVSNKCVGFNVDIGIRNQNIFYSFSVSQDNGSATSESINTQLNMVDQSSGRQTATQNVSLYNLYKQRSYKCTVVSLGNALLQPTMYFNLRHVPMFNGPYMIQDVTHTIQPGNFQTQFTGVRQGIYDLPAIDSFLQSINQNLITKLEEILKINKDSVTVSGTTNAINSQQLPQKADNTLDTTNSCESNVLKVYNPVNTPGRYVSVQGTATEINEKTLADTLKRLSPNSLDLQTMIYCMSYLKTFQQNSSSKIGKFYAWNNNLAMISLDVDWGPQTSQLSTTYSCIKSKSNPSTNISHPITHFNTLDSYVNFMISRMAPRIDQILEIGLTKYYVCFWPGSNVSSEYYDSHTSEFQQTTDTLYKALSSAVSVGLSSLDRSKDLKLTIQDNINKIKAALAASGTTRTSGTTTVDPFALFSGTTNNSLICPPPVFTSFAPLSGYTGTVVQVNGRYLSTTKSVKIMNVNVPLSAVTIYNDTTLRFIVPKIFTGDVNLLGKIAITTDHGAFSGNTLFNYNPALSGVTTSSPGSYTNPEAANKTPAYSATTGTTETKLDSSNLNPQNTGPIVLSAVTDTKDSIGSNTQLTVQVGPDAGDWKIYDQPEFNYKVIQITPGPDGKYKGQTVTTVNGSRLIGYVSANQQQFSINRVQMLDELRQHLDDEELENSKIYTSIELYVRPTDKVKNPQDVIQTYNFNLFLTDKKVGEPISNTITSTTGTTTGRTFAQKTISIIKIGESDSLQGNGWQYFNIKKPSGGYITFKFDAPEFNEKYYADQSIVNLNSDSVTYSSNGGADTKYTNVVTVNSLGEFKLKISYLPYGYTSPIGGQVLTQTVYSPIFTL